MRETGHSAPLVYDVGMHDGNDSAYYLAKGFDVVAIDANPSSCERCRDRFTAEIRAGRLTILNVGVSNEEGVGTFHVNLAEEPISTFVPERFAAMEWVRQEWREIDVPIVRLSDLIDRHGCAAFIKIDVEFFDQNVMLDLLRTNHRPPLISVEAQEIDTFCSLVCMGYRRFRLSSGEDVPRRFSRSPIRRLDGSEFEWSFPSFSSGPFGEDYPEPWLGKDAALERLMHIGPGWIDVHAAL